MLGKRTKESNGTANAIHCMTIVVRDVEGWLETAINFLDFLYAIIKLVAHRYSLFNASLFPRFTLPGIAILDLRRPSL
jgi:hypothetical protein